MKTKTFNKGVKMKFLVTALFALIFSMEVAASIRAYNTSNVDLGSFEAIKCPAGLVCSQVSGKLNMALGGDGTTALSGMLQQQLAGSSVMTASSCGNTFLNASLASAAFTLPDAASTTGGCRLTFIVATASGVTVDPKDSDDQILAAGASAGDALRSTSQGAVLILENISGSSLWAPVANSAPSGTWADVN